MESVSLPRLGSLKGHVCVSHRDARSKASADATSPEPADSSTCSLAATLQVHDHDGDRNDHDAEDGQEEVRLEERLPQAPFGTFLDDGPHVRPPDCSTSIHHASSERTSPRCYGRRDDAESSCTRSVHRPRRRCLAALRRTDLVEARASSAANGRARRNFPRGGARPHRPGPRDVECRCALRAATDNGRRRGGSRPRKVRQSAARRVACRDRGKSAPSRELRSHNEGEGPGGPAPIP